MLDQFVRDVLFGIIATITPMEPAYEPGAAVERGKSARTALEAIAAPAAYPVANEAPPANGSPPSVMRPWLIRTAVRADGLKVLGAGADHVDVRIFLP